MVKSWVLDEFIRTTTEGLVTACYGGFIRSTKAMNKYEYLTDRGIEVINSEYAENLI